MTIVTDCSGNNRHLAVTDGSAIYLHNRNYFEECSCSVEVASCTSPLTVYTIVLDLYSDAGGCHHTIDTITDGGVSQILTCNDNTFYTVSNRTEVSNYLLISFTRTTAGTGGSWMGFTATPGVELLITCPATAQTLCGDCGAPAPLGTVSTPNGTTYGRNAIYTCNQGYDLVGEAVTTCLADGTWSNAAPQCVAVECGAPAAPENGTVYTQSGTTYGQNGIYTCHQGYDLVGDAQTTCLANSTWSNAAPQCVAMDCGAPAAPENGTVSTPNGTTYGQNGIYTCHQGYDLVGDDETTCLADGTWRNATPQCVSMGNNGGQMTTAILIIAILVGVAIVAAGVIYKVWKRYQTTEDKPARLNTPDPATVFKLPETSTLYSDD